MYYSYVAIDLEITSPHTGLSMFSCACVPSPSQTEPSLPKKQK